MFFPRDPRKGDRIRADLEAQQDAEILRLGRFRVGPGLELRDGPSGIALALKLPERIFLRLTSSAGTGGSYAWVEVYHVHANTWEASPDRAGSTSVDPAYERGGSTSLTSGSTVYEARRSPTSGEWIFEA